MNQTYQVIRILLSRSISQTYRLSSFLISESSNLSSFQINSYKQRFYNSNRFQQIESAKARHMEASDNKTNVQHLKKERHLQIMRQGVKIYFTQEDGQALPYFYFSTADTYKVMQIINNTKYSLEVCYQSGYSYALLKREVFFMTPDYPQCIFLHKKQWANKLKQNQTYYLVKSNATLRILQSVYKDVGNIDRTINDFIHEKITKTTPNPIYVDDKKLEDLNRSQQIAVRKVLQNPITFIKGPPGCGKTKTIARICRFFGQQQRKVLVGGASNTAIKSIMKEIIKDFSQISFQPNITLFIFKETSYENSLHPPQVQIHTLRYKIIQNYQRINTSWNITLQVINYMLDMYWTQSNYETPPHFYAVYMQALSKVISQTQIMISTTVSASKINMRLKQQITFVPYIGILDEAAQTTWSDSLCFLVKGIKKVVFVGDEKQLTPTVISQNNELKKTMFSSLMNKNPEYFALLNTQYRMHPQIAEFPNQQFYEGKLQNGITQKQRDTWIPFFKSYPLSFLKNSTKQQQRISLFEKKNVTKIQKRTYTNLSQIQIISKILDLFPMQMLSTVGIITPYEEQLQMLIKKFECHIAYYGLTIRTCDGYQGGEKDFIIFSCVRSNQQANVGFCREENRLNVTITRAKKGLVIVGDPETFRNSDSESWKRYITYLADRKLILSLEEVEELIPLNTTVNSIYQ